MAFDTTPLWLICVSVSAPIAAVVGFAVQLRTVKNLRLENQKLTLEIEQLQKAKEESERRIIIPTTEEVKEYALFSRRRTHDSALPHRKTLRYKLILLKAASFEYAKYFLICMFFFYLLFDLYRVAAWLLDITIATFL